MNHPMNPGHPTNRRRLALMGISAIVMVAACGALAGCGQKGNLYLPSQQQKSKVPATQSPNARPPLPPP
jgi:predicted small lipoprotein YifL